MKIQIHVYVIQVTNALFVLCGRKKNFHVHMLTFFKYDKV